MNITETETLYRKEGRRYIPTYSLAAWNYEGDLMPWAASALCTHTATVGFEQLTQT